MIDIDIKYVELNTLEDVEAYLKSLPDTMLLSDRPSRIRLPQAKEKSADKFRDLCDCFIHLASEHELTAGEGSQESQPQQ